MSQCFIRRQPVLIAALFYSFSTAAADPSFSEVWDLIQNHHVKSIDELLPLLPLNYRSTALLNYSSLSSQGASDAFPRVVLPGNDGRLLMAFNGSPSQTGYNKLELIEFDKNKAAFTFREIEFDHENKSTPKYPELNPKRCYGCHFSHGEYEGRGLRPNWDSYFVWKGFFGSVEDRYQYDRTDYSAITRGRAEERKVLDSFLAEQAQKGRYRHLPLGEIFSESSKYFPNLQATEIIFSLNRLRQLALIENAPNYQNPKIGPLIRYILSSAEVSAYDHSFYEEFENIPEIRSFLIENRREKKAAGISEYSHSYLDQLSLAHFLGYGERRTLAQIADLYSTVSPHMKWYQHPSSPFLAASGHETSYGAFKSFRAAALETPYHMDPEKLSEDIASAFNYLSKSSKPECGFSELNKH